MSEEPEDGMLNDRASQLVDDLIDDAAARRVNVVTVGKSMVVDCGIHVPGSIAAGISLAEICTSGLMEINVVPGELGATSWPTVAVSTDDPLEACLFSQYAGWQISVGKYFAMGSGPMRAAAAREDLFHEFHYAERPGMAVGVLETSAIPTPEVFDEIAAKCELQAHHVTLLVAPTRSIAGSLQIVARSVETALHKMHELGLDVRTVASGMGWAPLPPPAKNDLIAIGRTNDAILYAGRVHLWVHGDDEPWKELGPQLPSSASPAFGKTFLKLFEEAGRDFYKIDKLLFSPAEIVVQNLTTGNVFQFGSIQPQIVRKSFGLD